ncbi:MAG: SDR family oxidoreductase [Burkholderiales bacterium]
MILVTGANGHLGRGIVKRLLLRLGPACAGKLAVSVRDPSRADDLARRSVTVRRGDFDNPAGLVATFLGIDHLVLVSTDGPRETRIAQHRNAIDAAREAGVQHVFYTSFIDAGPESPSEFAQVHAATEADLQASGLRHTILRNTLYADFLPMTVGAGLETGVFHLPAGTGRTTFLSRNELAEAIAAAVVAPTLGKGLYELTGSTAQDYAAVASTISRVTGKPLRYEPVSEEVYAHMLERYGVPGWMSKALANLYTAVAGGRFATVSQDFMLLTGRAPIALETTVTELFKR